MSTDLISAIFPRCPTEALVIGTLALGSRWEKVVLACVALLGTPILANAQQLDPRFSSTNGDVLAIAVAGGTAYIGGSFTFVGPYTGGGVPLSAKHGAPLFNFPIVHGSLQAMSPDGHGGWFIGGVFDSVGGLPRRNLAQVNADLSVTPWNPDANGRVDAMGEGGGRVFVAGQFSEVGGQTRRHIAALDAIDGLATGWDPNANGGVNALEISGSTIYVAGDFDSIGDRPRSHLAALDNVTGLATEWNPNADGGVFSLAIGGSTIYVGGNFENISGQPRRYIAALDTATGQANMWAPEANQVVRCLAVSGTRVFAGGDFDVIGGLPRPHIAALDVTTALADESWNPSAANGSIRAFAISEGLLFAGGDFDTIAGEPRSHIAALDVSTGQAAPWDPGASDFVSAIAANEGTVFVGGAFTILGGAARRYIAAIDVESGQLTAWDPRADATVWALDVDADRVYAGGDFTTIGGAQHLRVAALDITTAQALPWNPAADGKVTAIVANEQSVYVGGNFRNINGEGHKFVAALDRTLGVADRDWNPNPNSYVSAVVVKDTTVYIGGGFTAIGGDVRKYIAAVNRVTGLATAWSANANNVVSALALSGGTLYAGGIFTTIGRQPQARSYLAALDAIDGNATAWSPGASDAVKALATGGGAVYVGGTFAAIGAQPRDFIAALDSVTGDATDWKPELSGNAYAIAVDGSRVYVGGKFSIGAHSNLAEFDGAPIIRVRSVPASLVATVGDTAASAFSLQNIGLETLNISAIVVPDSNLSLEPNAPIRLSPGGQATVTLRFHPRTASAPRTEDIRIVTDDPYRPTIAVPIAVEGLELTAQVRALITGPRAPAGQAVTIQVVPVTHVERCSLYFRSGEDVEFHRVTMDTSGSTFIGIIPGTAVYETGVQYYVELENSGVQAFAPPNGRSGPDSIQVEPPTAITAFARPTSRSEFLPDSAISVEVALPPGAVYTSGFLHYRRGGDANYSSDALAGSQRPGIRMGTIPGSFVGPRGVEYWVEVTTPANVIPLTFPASRPQLEPDTIRVRVPVLADSSHIGGRYRLVSFPVDFETSPPNLFTLLSDQPELGTYDITRWRAFRYLPELGVDGVNVELSPTDNTGTFAAVPGRAFWLISRADHRVDTAPVAGLSTSTGGYYSIPLETGWNQIGDPFDFPVDWSSVLKPAGVDSLIEYDSSAGDWSKNAATTLRPFEGNFVYAPRPGTLMVPPMAALSGPSEQSRVERPAMAGDGWQIRLRATIEGAVDGSNFLGVDAAARDGQDALDQPKPPSAPGQGVRLGFRPPSEAPLRGLYRRDMRAPNADGHTWEIELRTSTPGELVTLEAVCERAPTDTLKLRLLDHELGISVDLHPSHGTLGSYQLLGRGSEQPYRLALILGNAAYVSQPREELKIPSQVVMDAPAPNPSRTSVALRFGLPEAQASTVAIYDLQGRRMATPLDRASVPAGYHVVLWDGTRDGGAPASGGIYFARLTTDTCTLTRRIVRLE